MTRLALLGSLLLLACAGPAPSPAPAPRAEPTTPARTRREGITVERLRGPPATEGGDEIVTLVRFDMSRYRLVLLTARSGDGTWHTLPEWARIGGLVAGINAALFESDGRATALLLDDGVPIGEDDERFGGVLAFGPLASSDPAFVLTGRDCPGGELEGLRARYRSVVVNYRLLDCAGAPIAWVDDRRYSSAAFGLDDRGRLVLVHARTPYLMRDFARWLADPALGLRAMHYVEGGPKATLFVDAGEGEPLVLTGSRDEDGHATADTRGPRPIPNVLGLVPIEH